MDRAKAKRITLRIVRRAWMKEPRPVIWIAGQYAARVVNREFYARVIVSAEGVKAVPYDP